MSDKSRGGLDYRILHETDRKVFKSDRAFSAKMDTTKEATEELKIREDINHSLFLYNLDDLITEEEIKEGVEIVSDLSKHYRHIHVELKGKMGDEEYNTKYPGYDKTLRTLTDFVKTAKIKLRAIREDNLCHNEKILRAFENEEQNRQKEETLKIEEGFIEIKIRQVEDMLDLETVKDIQDIDDYVSRKREFH